jgi:hypothetical protein
MFADSGPGMWFDPNMVEDVLLRRTTMADR